MDKDKIIREIGSMPEMYDSDIDDTAFNAIADYVIQATRKAQESKQKEIENLLRMHENAMCNLENKHKENKELRNLLDYYIGRFIKI